MRPLHVRGQLPEGGVAIIGSREPPGPALAFAYELARRLGRPVVAGLAPGIDTAAHRGAIDGGQRTAAFVGYGFGASDLPENAALEREIVERGGAVATLRDDGEPVTGEAKIERDRLQAEHSVAVVLVSSEIGGGAMHTMAFARELGRMRFAVQPQVGDAWSGNARALADGAFLLPFDVDEALKVLHGHGI